MEYRSHFISLSQNTISGLAKRRNGLDNSCLQLAFVVALCMSVREAAMMTSKEDTTCRADESLSSGAKRQTSRARPVTVSSGPPVVRDAPSANGLSASGGLMPTTSDTQPHQITHSPPLRMVPLASQLRLYLTAPRTCGHRHGSQTLEAHI